MRKTTLIFVIVLTIAVVLFTFATDIPPRPEKLVFHPLQFEPPNPASLSRTLDNGIPVYISEDRQLPLVTITLWFRGGKYLEPKGKEGLAELLGVLWRSGGAGDMEAKALDEELDFLAANLSTTVGGSLGSVSLNVLSKDFARGYLLFLDVLTKPRFASDRLAKAKADMIAEMQRRNDDSAQIEEREWDRLIYGDEFWRNRLATKASVDGITREDLITFHRQLTNPANFVMAVSGDFDRAEMLAQLNSTIGAIKVTGPKFGPVTQPTSTAKPGVYLVNKPDVNQGRVSIGHVGAVRPLADEAAITVANDILGAGATAWITTKVRSDEGLAYEAASFFSIGDLYPGDFRAIFQTKSATVVRAIKITLEQIERIRTADVTDTELSTSKKSMIDSFPRYFESKQGVVNLFAMDDLLGRPHDYWKSYRENAATVTSGSVKTAAQAHIKTDRLIILIVGNLAEILKPNPNYPGLRLEKFGPITRLPVQDPMTLQPLEKQ